MHHITDLFWSCARRAASRSASWYPPKRFPLYSYQMIGILTAALVAGTAEARAMNQEGHDEDWIIGFPPGLQLLEAIPEARPLPSKRCPVSTGMLAANPYEQIQLPQHRCKPAFSVKVLPLATPGLTIKVED